MTFEERFMESFGDLIDAVVARKVHDMLKDRKPEKDAIRKLVRAEITEFYKVPYEPTRAGEAWSEADEECFTEALNNFIAAYAASVERTFGAIRARIIKRVQEKKL